MSQEEVGAYIRLLCHQWNRGSIPVETERQQRLACGSVSVHVLSKFRIGSDGLLRNDRLEEERAKLEAFRQKQREKGIKSGIARTTVEPRLNHGSIPVEIRLQPEGNSPSPSPIKEVSTRVKGTTVEPRLNHGSELKEEKSRGTLEEVLSFCASEQVLESDARWFFHKCEGNGWVNGKNKIKNWRATIRAWKAAKYLPSQKPNESRQQPMFGQPKTIVCGTGNF